MKNYRKFFYRSLTIMEYRVSNFAKIHFFEARKGEEE